MPRAPLIRYFDDPASGPLESTEPFAGRYLVQRWIAQGGMGCVWEALDLAAESERDRLVALKVLNPKVAPGARARERLRREAAVATSLQGSHFVRVLDHGVHEALPFITFELLRGETLAEHFRHAERLSPAQCLWILRQAASALAVAHSMGIVHRDVSPANLFLAAEGPLGEPILKVLDFGVATHAFFESRLTAPGMLIGSPHYMSPEQTRPRGVVSERSDLWSLAVVLYRALTGRRPFDGKMARILLSIARDDVAKPSCVVPGLRPEIDEFFRVALAKDAKHRFASANDMTVAFEQVVGAVAGERAAREAGAPRVSIPSDEIVHCGRAALKAGRPFVTSPVRQS
ncbi:MAG: serine/threonine protein kinase [Polyangiaceae bacterium]|nr:serine/threonine protein kinase [Polyangiaceae bacterium]